ncbi:MAG: GntR family transcriptional regulator [Rubrobacter sp.]|jgi:DNA-binding GntR family transcriptional regulator|nr:GntR family transcriptional regulator [Rubrobacter sp.]MDQ3316020.1 GntR family transcriptional regulator [Actinomycetota bacterium]MDQ3430035.1 GntR family transcriptional regulator [Actinomycetota bacterium]
MIDALEGVRLNHSSPVPLYHQAAQALEAAIEDGRLPRGSKLGGEVELATRLGISRPTMRAAMKQLVDKGLLIRRRGIGTMVAPRPVRRTVALTSLFDDLNEAGREPRTRLLSLERVPCPPEVADHLGLEPNAAVLRFERLRLAGSDPIALMSNVVPDGLMEIREEDLERTGLYELFRGGGVSPNVATQRVGARKAGAEEAELLEMEPGDPVLTMTRIAYDTDGRPIEYGSHRYPAESYWFEMMLVDL